MFYPISKAKIALFSSIATLLFFSCNTHHETHEQEEVHLLVSKPLIKDTTILQEYVCQIHAVQHIELRAMERGYLEKIFVDEGQMVKKGQLMFQTMPQIYEAELKKAEAVAKFAEIEYQNTKALADSNIVSPNELALSKAEWDKAKAEQALAAAHLQFTEIRAPFSGLMDHFHVRNGSLLEEGELLTELSDNSELWVYFNVPEAEYLDYQSRKHDSAAIVQLKMANNKIFNQVGRVTTIEADFNNHTGNIAFRATFPNPEGLLRHGETGNVLMPIKLEKALLIPQKASFEVLDKKYVYVVDENNIVHARQIWIQEELPHLYAISNGLSADDLIVIEGIRKIREKDHVSYDFSSPEAVLKSLNLYAE